MPCKYGFSKYPKESTCRGQQCVTYEAQRQTASKHRERQRQAAWVFLQVNSRWIFHNAFQEYKAEVLLFFSLFRCFAFSKQAATKGMYSKVQLSSTQPHFRCRDFYITEFPASTAMLSILGNLMASPIAGCFSQRAVALANATGISALQLDACV